jgi:Cu+-exporting ATPase
MSISHERISGTKYTEDQSKRVADPVCGMEIDGGAPSFKEELEGQTFYFCSAACREEFRRDPAQYV